MMYDLERITKIIKDIEKYFFEMESLDINQLSDLEDKKNYHAISMVLFTIINRTIDLGNEVVMANKFGMPSTYTDIFRILWRNKIINSKMQKEISDLIRYRNRLSHEYQDLSEEEIFGIFERIEMINGFIDIIKDIINKRGA